MRPLATSSVRSSAEDLFIPPWLNICSVLPFSKWVLLCSLLDASRCPTAVAICLRRTARASCLSRLIASTSDPGQGILLCHSKCRMCARVCVWEEAAIDWLGICPGMATWYGCIVGSVKRADRWSILHALLPRNWNRTTLHTHILHSHCTHTLHTHSGHALSCGNQNDDVKIFVHWACRFHFEPNGSISLHLFLNLHQLRLLRGFHLQQVSWAWLSVWLPARPSRISMALIVMGHWSAQPAAHWVDVFAGFGPRWWLLR